MKSIFILFTLVLLSFSTLAEEVNFQSDIALKVPKSLELDYVVDNNYGDEYLIKYTDAAKSSMLYAIKVRKIPTHNPKKDHRYYLNSYYEDALKKQSAFDILDDYTGNLGLKGMSAKYIYFNSMYRVQTLAIMHIVIVNNSAYELLGETHAQVIYSEESKGRANELEDVMKKIAPTLIVNKIN